MINHYDKNVSPFFEDFFFDVLGDFGVLVDFIDGNEGEDVLGGDDLLLQILIELHPSQKHDCEVEDAQC